jgi:WD40 repeat protein
VTDPKANVHRFDVELWDVSTDKKIRTFQGDNSDAPYKLVFSPDGKRLAGHTEANLVRGVVKLWDVSKGELLFTLQGHETFIARVAFSPDGARLASAGLDTAVKVWDLSTGKLIYTLKQDQAVHSVAFSPDGKRLASGSSSGQIKIWDAGEGVELLTLVSEGHTDSVRSLAFRSGPGGEFLVSVGPKTNSVMLWDGSPLRP